jgi:hypothetical protein
VDVEVVAGLTARAGQPIGMEQVEVLLAASLLIHEVDDREVHEGGSEEMIVSRRVGQRNRSAPG